MFRCQLTSIFTNLTTKNMRPAFRTLISSSFRQSLPRHLEIHPEVRNALDLKKPVVALESTIITHGMPHPENVETALEVENLVRSHGAIPATIGIIDGCIKVGLTERELTELAQKPRENLIKCSRRDLPYVIATKQSGGTTVAATMIVADSVGIPIFATGGIGGVHRNGHITLDISADLVELGRTPVIVVSAGIKSILDIPRTLEYLETQGVCVATFNSPGGVFPDFYTRDSGCKVPYNLIDATSAAQVIRQWQQLNLKSGMLIGVPIPEEFAANKIEIDNAIEKALAKAEAKGIEGKEVTPFLLAAISQSTQGNSLRANIELIKNNAVVAAKIAKKLMQIDESQNCSNAASQNNKPLVIGASILDLSFMVNEREGAMVLGGATYTAEAKQTAGGVGRNVAEGILKLYGDVHFISAIGSDYLGQSLVKMMPPTLQSHLIVDKQIPTSLCSLIFDKKGECKLILGNMDIHHSITPESIATQSQLFEQSKIVVIDSNISPEAMKATLKQAKKHNLPVFFEPTDMFIAGKPFQLPNELTQYIRILTPNIHELKTIVQTITTTSTDWNPNANLALPELLNRAKTLLKQIDTHFNCIIVTLGHHGVLLSLRSDAVDDISKLLDVGIVTSSTKMMPHTTLYYAAPKVDNVVNVSGAGDSFSAGFITALLQNRKLDGCVALGFLAAERALQSESAVPSHYFSDAAMLEDKYKQTLDSLQMKSI